MRARITVTIYVMRCPSCDADVPDGDYVCGECGAYAYSNVPAVPYEKAVDAVTTPAPATPFVRPKLPSRRPRVPLERHAQPTAPTAPTAPRAWPSPYPPGSGGPDFAYPPIHGWPGLAPEPGTDEPAIAAARAGASMPVTSPIRGAGAPVVASVINEPEMRRRGRTMAKWSIGLAALTILLPIFGPVGIVTGYFAWRLGETRLGRIGVALSVAAMVVGLTLTLALVPPSQR